MAFWIFGGLIYLLAIAIALGAAISMVRMNPTANEEDLANQSEDAREKDVRD